MAIVERDPTSAGAEQGEATGERRRVAREAFLKRRYRPLSGWLRIALLLGGTVLVLVGLAGLVLPGIQGILTLVLGAAMLSLASATVHRWLRNLFRGWPRSWRRLESFRRRLHRWLAPSEKSDSPPKQPDD